MTATKERPYVDTPLIAHAPKHIIHRVRVTEVRACPRCQRQTYTTEAGGSHGCMWNACMHRKAE